MPLGEQLSRTGGLLILLGFVIILLTLPVAQLDVLGRQDALLWFGFGGLLVVLFGFLSAVVGTGLGMDEGGVSSIPDEELTPEQRLRKQELALREQKQQQEGAEKVAQFFFGGNQSGGGGQAGGTGTKNLRDGFSVTDSVRQTKNKYTGKYIRSPKCPNCGSQATAPAGDDDNVFQCDKCGNIFETRARTRRDVNLNVED